MVEANSSDNGHNPHGIRDSSMDRPLREICCIGAGYVGGPTMAVIAHKCPDIKVFVVDSSHEKIEQWNSEKIPIYEPGLLDIIHQCRGKNLFFSNDIEKHVRLADMIFISVDTPTKRAGVGKGRAADMKNLEHVSRLIAKYSNSSKVIVEKSTVPVKAAESIKNILGANKRDDIDFEVLSNPEFMAEGTAIDNLVNPDRILIGGDVTSVQGLKAMNQLKELYLRWIDESKIITTNTWSSELSKLAANAFLAQRLSSINSLATVCESTGADIKEVARAIGSDSRIGSKYLKAGIGFGGSCFQKDVLNLVYLCECLNLKEVADYWYKVIEMNDYQRIRAARRIVKCLHNTVNEKRIAIYGFSFKSDTGDTRESSARYLSLELLEEGAKLCIYDPKVDPNQIISDLHRFQEKVRRPLYESVETFKDPYQCVRGCHAIVVCTDWEEFSRYDYSRIYESMEKPAFIFDGRMILDERNLKNLGFNFEAIGRASKPMSYNWI